MVISKEEMEEFQERVKKFQKEFQVLLEQAEKPKPGVYDIEVAEVLAVGHFYFAPPEVAVVKDTEGKIWSIPESHGEGALVSRHDVRPGMKLSLTVEREATETCVTNARVLK